MKVIDVSDRENVPLSDDEFVNVLEQVLATIDVNDMKEEESIENNYIFNGPDGGVIGGYEIGLNIFKEENKKLGVLLTKFILYETEDEWIDAYSRIKKEKEK